MTLSYMKIALAALSLFIAGTLSWQRFALDQKATLRGISAVDADACWVGGSESTLARTIDGGRSWQYFHLVEANDFEFRDVEALSRDTAVVMSAGEGEKSKIFRTVDGGKTWTTAYENHAPKGFFNGIAFWDSKDGILTGDPIDDKPFMLLTHDGGASWERIANLPPIKEGEYGFAASGSHITVSGDHVWIGTGGTVSRVFHSPDRGRSWEVNDTPMLQGAASQGIFSIAFDKNGFGISVGGDYNSETTPGSKNLIISHDFGKTWRWQRRRCPLGRP